MWSALSDLGNVHQRLLPGYVADTRIDGDVGYLTMPTGAVIREYIVTVGDEARRLAYSAVERFKLPIEHHHGSFQVLPDDAGARLVWVTDVLPHAAAAEARMRIVRGLEVMRETTEAHTMS